MTALIPAVIYARYSSSGQREESIVGQLRDCHAYADRKGFKIVKEYTDEAMTGTNDRRPAFQKMIRDADRGIFQVVIVWKFDRFARDRADSAMYKKKLRSKGVRVLSAMEDVGEGAASSVTESIFEGIAEWYSRNLSENVRRGNMDSALEHKTLGTHVYGYRTGSDGRYEIDPVESQVVKRIFSEYCSGMSIAEICDRLNQEGIKNAIGHPWGKSSMKIMLGSEKYIGVYKFKDLRFEDGMPAIISQDVFAAAQAVKEKHKKAANLKSDTYLLSGKLFCGHCGCPMTGEYAIGEHGQRYEYYVCIGKKRGSCKKKRVVKSWIEDAVIDFLFSELQDHDFVDQMVDGFMSWQEKKAQDDSDLQVIRSRQKQNQRELERIKAAILKAPASDTLIEMLQDNEKTRDQLAVAEKKEQLRIRPKIERADLYRWFAGIASGSHDSPKFKERMVDVFLDRVFLYDDGTAVVSFNLGTGRSEEVTIEIVQEAISSGSISGRSGLPESSDSNFWIHDGVVIVETRFEA
jgi:DNA invertase Pin-like site-specific DNA recombinase